MKMLSFLASGRVVSCAWASARLDTLDVNAIVVATMIADLHWGPVIRPLLLGSGHFFSASDRDGGIGLPIAEDRESVSGIPSQSGKCVHARDRGWGPPEPQPSGLAARFSPVGTANGYERPGAAWRATGAF